MDVSKLRLPRIAYMIIPSLNTLGFPDWSLAQVIAFTGAHQVPYIEVRALERTLDLLSLPDFSNPQRAGQALALLRGAHARILSFNLGIHLSDDLTSSLPAIHAYAALAQQFDVPYLRFFSGGKPTDRPDLERLASGARQVMDLLAPYPVQMLIETHDSLVRTPDILALNERLDGKLNILWDIAHTQNFGGEPWKETYASLKPLIRYLHVKDTRRVGEKLQNTLLFAGDLPVRELLTYLSGEPQEIIVSFEWEKMWDPTLPPGDAAAEDFLAKIQPLTNRQRISPRLS